MLRQMFFIMLSQDLFFTVCKSMDARMITIVAIIGRNGVIGAKGKVPWRISEDMRHFRKQDNPYTPRLFYGDVIHNPISKSL